LPQLVELRISKFKANFGELVLQSQIVLFQQFELTVRNAVELLDC
jgi:hypothetical protein